MSEEFLFSIIIPTYNRSELLLTTLQSIQKIESSDFEVLVIDDGGDDDTEEAVKSLADSRISYHYKDNAERGAARNYGARVATGKYLNFFDSDDIAYPNHLSLAREAIGELGSPQVFALSYDIRSPQMKLQKEVRLRKPVPKFIFEGNHLSCNGVFVLKEIALIHSFNEDRVLSGSEDFELWLRLAARFPFPVRDKASHAVIDHIGRSTLNYKPEALIKRKMKMLEYAFADAEVNKKFGRYKKQMKGNALLYISLHLMLSGYKSKALTYLVKSIQTNPSNFLNKTTFAVLKRIFS